MSARDKYDKDLVNAWLEAASDLGIRVVAPFQLTTPNGEMVWCEAHVLDFGGPNGIFIGNTDRTFQASMCGGAERTWQEPLERAQGGGVPSARSQSIRIGCAYDPLSDPVPVLSSTIIIKPDRAVNCFDNLRSVMLVESQSLRASQSAIKMHRW